MGVKYRQNKNLLALRILLQSFTYDVIYNYTRPV